MICFQTLDLRSLITTGNLRNCCITRCDLLSNFRFTFFDYNDAIYDIAFKIVVICFQTLDLRSLITTSCTWISLRSCCDLLSNFRFTFFDYNRTIISRLPLKVVICFQTLDLRSLITTTGAILECVFLL